MTIISIHSDDFQVSSLLCFLAAYMITMIQVCTSAVVVELSALPYLPTDLAYAGCKVCHFETTAVNVIKIKRFPEVSHLEITVKVLVLFPAPRSPYNKKSNVRRPVHLRVYCVSHFFRKPLVFKKIRVSVPWDRR